MHSKPAGPLTEQSVKTFTSVASQGVVLVFLCFLPRVSLAGVNVLILSLNTKLGLAMGLRRPLQGAAVCHLLCHTPSFPLL